MTKASRTIEALPVDETLSALDDLLFHGAHRTFSEILCQIRSSSVAEKHQELEEKILDDAKGLGMLGGVEVDSTIEHLRNEHERCKRENAFPRAISVSGHAIRVHALIARA